MFFSAVSHLSPFFFLLLPSFFSPLKPNIALGICSFSFPLSAFQSPLRCWWLMNPMWKWLFQNFWQGWICSFSPLVSRCAHSLWFIIICCFFFLVILLLRFLPYASSLCTSSSSLSSLLMLLFLLSYLLLFYCAAAFSVLLLFYSLLLLRWCIFSVPL